MSKKKSYRRRKDGVLRGLKGKDYVEADSINVGVGNKTVEDLAAIASVNEELRRGHKAGLRDVSGILKTGGWKPSWAGGRTIDDFLPDAMLSREGIRQRGPLSLDQGTEAVHIEADRSGRPLERVGGPGFVIDQDEEDEASLAVKLKAVRRRLAALEEIKEWLDRGDLTLGRAGSSLFHNLLQEGVIDDPDFPAVISPKALMAYQLFVVEHDWAKAFVGATGYDDQEVRMPYDKCAFELILGGKRFISFVDDDPSTTATLLIRTSVGWYRLAPFLTKDKVEAFWPVVEALGRQIKAISVALEAKVADVELRSAPTVKRKTEGVLTPRYHVVRLSRRHAKRYVYEAHEPSYRIALHFRSGHFKHYHLDLGEEGHVHTWLPRSVGGREPCGCGAWRTWTEWMLVGDPDLGFIDKEYRL